MTTVSPPSFNVSFEPEKEDCPYVYPAVWVWRKTYLTEKTYRNLVAVTCINLLAGFPTVLLNALVIYVVATRRRLQTNTNILLACLAGTDLLTGLVVYPLAIALKVERILGIGPFCTLEKLNSVAVFVISNASLFHLVLLSIDRYIAVKFSLRYMEIVTKRRLMTAVVLAWAVNILLLFIQEITFVVANSNSAFKRVKDAILFIFLLLCIVATIYTNCYIFSETRRQKRRIRTEQVTYQEAKRMKKDKKAANTLAIILAALTLTYLPVMVTGALLQTAQNKIKPRVLAGLVSNWIAKFIWLSSLLNPIIYCWRITEIRRAFLDILHFRQQDNMPRTER